MATKKHEYTPVYAQETLTYSIAKTTDQPAARVTLDLLYNSTQSKEEAKLGYYQVLGVSGTYTELDANGKASTTYPVTGPLPQQGFRGNDNRIYIAKGDTGTTIVDKHGLGFDVSMGSKTRPDLMEHINLSYPGTAGTGYEQVAELEGKSKRDVSAVTSLKGSASRTTTARAATEEDLAAAVCFAAGTRILTTRGEVAVEALAVGDLVVTATGAARPIRWLGHRIIDTRRHPRPREVMPVRIAAHAFGPLRPTRDLRVSPGHAICLDVLGQVLVPAGALVDGTTIVQEVVERITYWHVELDTHDVLLAENLPAESYLEMRNRGFFLESDVVGLAAAPDAQVTTHADFCRPFVDHGPVLEAARGQVAARAAASVASPAARPATSKMRRG